MADVTITTKLNTASLLIENAVKLVYSYILVKYPEMDTKVAREELRIIAR